MVLLAVRCRSGPRTQVAPVSLEGRGATARPTEPTDLPSQRRLVGVDVARCLAVLGMFTAHVGSATESFWTATGWLQVADGRSAATFAFLAGVSLGLLTGGADPVSGRDLHRARVRVLVRCALLWVVGAAMIALDTPVAVILPSYAVMLATATVALRLDPRLLLLAAALAAALGPLVIFAVRSVVPSGGQLARQPVDVLVGEHYPAAVWIAYVLAGLAVVRLDLRRPGRPRQLVLLGSVVAVGGYGAAAVATRAVGGPITADLLTAAPHSDTTLEVLGNTGVALAVLGLCLLVAPRAPRAVAPFAATGALALTVYCGHLVAIAVLGDDVVWSPTNTGLLGFVAITLAAATLWRATLGRGPLERVLHEVSTRTARLVVPPRTPAP
jgi:uncharacterized membrane protein